MMITVASAAVSMITIGMPRVIKEEQHIERSSKDSPISAFESILNLYANTKGKILKSELEDALKDERMAPSLEYFELPCDSILALFDLMDIQRDKMLHIDAFVTMVVRSNDPVNTLMMMNETRKLSTLILQL